MFWQVHPGAATTLAEAVLECVDPQPGDRIVDLFSGAGLFSALLGERVGASGSVMAVERDVQACADATANTTDLPWVEVRRGNVGPELVAQRIGDPHVVVLDPAREGAGRAVMAALAAKGGALRQIVYVSCDPATFARDVRVMLDGGWQLASLRAFDLFPMTEHVELLGVLVPPPA